MKAKAREGDLLETTDRVFFDVKGLVHPPGRIVAFLRYVPDSNGARKKDENRYRKVYALSERYSVLRQLFPKYLVYDPVFNEYLCVVPVENVRKHYQPIDHLGDLRYREVLDKTESQALLFTEILKKAANVPWNKLGISGSILVGLHTPGSDIDPVIYGSKPGYKVYSALKSLLEDDESNVKRYGQDELRTLFDFRSKDTVTSFENFVRTESRKVLQGKFMERDYFIRFVKDWNEIEEKYGTILYKSVGYTKIRAKVVDDSEAIFTPCSYKIDDVKVIRGVHVESIEEIVSFRGRFCEQARSGEVVIAQGKVERLQKEGTCEHFRLLLGNKVSDHMIIA
ncbi:MAG: nucleotidyltransferase domain-containing protein [Candidatus Bathyarchaeota archaeon]|nr:MAG: nucleotidyltransferase domain-containing protein [Candidatus Bathyarchaeota archaeon]